MDKMIKDHMKKNLIWLPELKIGYYPIHNNPSTPYDDEYFDKYVHYENTKIGECLNKFRINLVNKYTKGLVLDIGIGCGTFIKQRRNCLGYDICKKAVRLLKKLKVFYSPYNEDFEKKGIEAITFFDSLEHIRNPERILNKIKGQFVFISIPIFKDVDHLFKSKHLKKNEHRYYFTDYSIVQYMKYYGFSLIEFADDEIKCGREDIYTYVFERIKCKSCFWYRSPTLPADKKRYGNKGMCLNLESKKDCINENDLVCQLYLNKNHLWDKEKNKFVHTDEIGEGG